MTPTQYNDEIDEILNELNNSLAIADHYDTTEDRTYELQAISKAKQRLQTLIKQAEVRKAITILKATRSSTTEECDTRIAELEAQLNNLEREKR